ncbi:hypothetical protein PENTCL1PPCAC_10955, partial [Pristionchus entomophagus]
DIPKVPKENDDDYVKIPEEKGDDYVKIPEENVDDYVKIRKEKDDDYVVIPKDNGDDYIRVQNESRPPIPGYFNEHEGPPQTQVVGKEKKSWRKGHAFLAAVSQKSRKEFYVIYEDVNLSRDEMRTKLATWTRGNEVKDEISSYFKSENAKSQGWEATEAIEALPEAYKTISAILRDSSLSRKNQLGKMEEMTKEYSRELKSLHRSSLPCGGRYFNRHRQWKNCFLTNSASSRSRS